jgi:capsular polysaccharide biosynthesis protein
LWVTDYWSRGYFHWLTDALPRLFVMRDRLDQLTLMLPGAFETLDFVSAALAAFGVRSVGFIKQDEVLECRSLLMPTHTAPSGQFREETIRGVRDVLLSAFGNSDGQATAERVYISRRAAGKRRIANEEQIIPILTSKGFQIVCAEDLTFEQQVRLASQTRYLVSNHGAGLANMLFMPAQGKILELRHRADYINNCYFVLSSALGLNYFYQLCDAQNPYADPHTADLIVEPKELENSLDLLLTSP